MINSLIADCRTSASVPKRRLAFVSFLLLPFSFLHCSLQGQEKDWNPSIDEKSLAVIDRCIEAMGGEMTLKSMDTIELKGVTEREMLHSGGGSASKSSNTLFLKGKASRSLSRQANGQEVEWVQNGKSTWSIIDGNEENASVMNPPTVQVDSDPWPGTVLGWKDSDKLIQFVAQSEYKGAEVNTLAFKRYDGALTHFHFDTEDGLLLAVEHKFNMENEKEFKIIKEFEYKMVEGVALPLTQRIIQPEIQNSKTDYEIVELGGEIPDKYFEMTPALEKRMKEIKERMRKLNEAKASQDK